MFEKTGRRKVRSHPKKPAELIAKKRKRETKFRTEDWYANAVSSIAITNTGRGDRISGHWVSQLKAE
jgi:hypothetical protein